MSVLMITILQCQQKQIVLGFTDHGCRNWSEDTLHDCQVLQIVMRLSQHIIIHASHNRGIDTVK